MPIPPHHHQWVLTLIVSSVRAYPPMMQRWGRTPLMVAADNGHDATCTALIKAGADVNAKDVSFVRGVGANEHKYEGS